MFNAVTWFEIPASDFDRAVTFYSQVLGQEVRRGDYMGIPHGFFPYESPGVGGAIVLEVGKEPSQDGVCMYLKVDDVEGAVTRAQQAGGKLVLPKTDIGEPGYMAIIIDSEGNRIGLHELK